VTTLLIGRGLLGRQLEARLRRRSNGNLRTVDVAWGSHDAALRTLLDAAGEVARDSPSWRLVWCAGAGVIATPPADLMAEVRLFDALLDGLPAPPRSMFLASSAGGVYAGSPDRPPFTERSAAAALSPYGAAKLEMERLAGGLTGSGARLLVGRIANLYGPGQDLTKPQGLISQLCVTQQTGRALNLHVSLDTLRDYLFVTDAATMLVAALDLLDEEEPGTTVTKIFASGRALSVAAVVGEAGRVLRRRPLLSTRAGSGSEVRDLRLRSVVWPQVDILARTPLPAGLGATAADISAQLRAGEMRPGC
jgi:UDP-glucose 4-epimerase